MCIRDSRNTHHPVPANESICHDEPQVIFIDSERCPRYASMVTIDRMLARDSKPKVDGGVVRSLLPASRRTGSAHATGSLDPVLPHAAHPAGMFATIPNHRSGAAHGHMGGIGTLLQAKLKVGAVDDPLEHEADRAADAVMSDGVASVRGAASGSPVQRACAACSAGEGKCPKCDEEHQVQRKPLDAAASPSGVDGHVGTALASGGQPLSSSMRAFMEPRFGRDFSTVRVHAGQAASHAAAALGARAFTIGRNIVFGASEYAPETAAGQRLVAHELAHVVQQSTGTHATVQR